MFTALVVKLLPVDPVTSNGLLLSISIVKSVLVLFSISLNAIFLGIIGEYLARIYNQIKKRPITIIEESVDNN